MTRVLFIGSSEGFSHHFAAYLAERSADPGDDTTLVGIVSPRRHRTPRERARFTAKRAISRGVHHPTVRPMLRPIMHGRGTSTVETLQRIGSQLGVPVRWPQGVGDELVAIARELDAELCVLAGLDRILRAEALTQLPPVLNIHTALLPDYRGPTPEFWQLDHGATQSGVTIHRIDAGVDTGPIVAQRSFPLAAWHDRVDIRDLGIACALELLATVLDALPSHLEHATTQVGVGSHHRAPTPTDREAPFTAGATAVFNRARAYGWPEPLLLHVDPTAWRSGRAVACPAGAHTVTIELYQPVVLPDDPHLPSGVLAANATGGAALGCTSGVAFFRRAVTRTT